jgi:hypothetical protein
VGDGLFNINKINMINRELKVENKKLYDLLKQNEVIAEEINAKVEEWKKVDEWVKKQMNRQERIKEKIRPIVADYITKNTELGEFEVVGSTKLIKGEPVITIIDLIEMRKAEIRDSKQKDVVKKVEDKING